MGHEHDDASGRRSTRSEGSGRTRRRAVLAVVLALVAVVVVAGPVLWVLGRRARR
jgi:hypothetical protein